MIQLQYYILLTTTETLIGACAARVRKTLQYYILLTTTETGLEPGPSELFH